MKQFLMATFFLASFVMAPLMVLARISNFNEIIDENVQSQNSIHTSVQAQIMEGKTVVEAAAQPMMVEGQTSEMASPTRKKFLRHKKELTNFQPSAKAQKERVASEIDAADEL